MALFHLCDPKYSPHWCNSNQPAGTAAPLEFPCSPAHIWNSRPGCNSAQPPNPAASNRYPHANLEAYTRKNSPSFHLFFSSISHTGTYPVLLCHTGIFCFPPSKRLLIILPNVPHPAILSIGMVLYPHHRCLSYPKFPSLIAKTVLPANWSEYLCPR